MAHGSAQAGWHPGSVRESAGLPSDAATPPRRRWALGSILFALAAVVVVLGRLASTQGRSDVDHRAEEYVELVERVAPTLDLSGAPLSAFGPLTSAGVLAPGQGATGIDGATGIQFDTTIVADFGSAKRCVHVELRHERPPVIENIEGACRRPQR